MAHVQYRAVLAWTSPRGLNTPREWPKAPSLSGGLSKGHGH